jgi:transposase-like protein
MLSAEANESGVYFVDNHFVPYAGKPPLAKGYNTKRRHAERGRADTMVCDLQGRAVCFTSGESGGLSTTLPGALAQLRTITGPTAKIMLGFDRGGACPVVFTACRDAGVDWITYRRAPLVAPQHLPVTTTITRAGKQVQITLAEETVTINGYGQGRQITLFEHGQPVLQILTSNLDSCAGALMAFLRARWRIENLFKYLDFYGIDALADYTATIETNTRLIDNPARTQLNTRREQLAQLTGH